MLVVALAAMQTSLFISCRSGASTSLKLGMNLTSMPQTLRSDGHLPCLLVEVCFLLLQSSLGLVLTHLYPAVIR